MKNLILLFVITSLFSCATKDELRRREQLKQLTEEMKGSQQSTTSLMDKINQYEESLSALKNDIQKNQFENNSNYQSRFEEFDKSFALLTEEVKTLKENEKTVIELRRKVESQEKYIKQVITTLSQLSGKKSKSQKNVSPYDLAMKNYKRGRYKTAKKQLLELASNNKIKGKKKARIIHNLGMIEYMNKSYEKATVYFSRLYTEWPKLSYNANGLLFLAKSFRKQKKSEEAKQTLNELISKFPKTKSATKGKKLLKEL